MIRRIVLYAVAYEKLHQMELPKVRDGEKEPYPIPGNEPEDIGV